MTRAAQVVVAACAVAGAPTREDPRGALRLADACMAPQLGRWAASLHLVPPRAPPPARPFSQSPRAGACARRGGRRAARGRGRGQAGTRAESLVLSTPPPPPPHPFLLLVPPPPLLPPDALFGRRCCRTACSPCMSSSPRTGAAPLRSQLSSSHAPLAPAPSPAQRLAPSPAGGGRRGGAPTRGLWGIADRSTLSILGGRFVFLGNGAGALVVAGCAHHGHPFGATLLTACGWPLPTRACARGEGGSGR